MLLIMGAMFVGIYFLMIRPQQKRRREVEAMQSSIGPGDEVITVGGLYGTVEAIDEADVMLEIAPGVTARYAKGAISRVVTPAARADDLLDDEIVDDEPETLPGTATDKKIAGTD